MSSHVVKRILARPLVDCVGDAVAIAKPYLDGKAQLAVLNIDAEHRVTSASIMDADRVEAITPLFAQALWDGAEHIAVVEVMPDARADGFSNLSENELAAVAAVRRHGDALGIPVLDWTRVPPDVEVGDAVHSLRFGLLRHVQSEAA